ncbi:MAG: RIP metalloprotease RseP [Paracoccaceae bacterium]
MELIGLIPNFGNLLFTLGAFVIALLVIVSIHEYGHYIVGRWTGIHAEVFSLGMGPVIWSRADKHGTLWQIAALPIGGYVRFLGDSSAASGKDGDAISTMSPEDRRRTMHGAPVWARALTVAAGPIFNFILSIIVFAAIIAWQGTASDPLTISELRPFPTEQGLLPGDEILEIAGKQTPKLEEFSTFVQDLPTSGSFEYLVRRDGLETSVIAPNPYPALVVGLTPGSAAYDAGMEVGDVIVSVDGQPVPAFGALREIVGTSDGKPMLLGVWRDGEETDLTLVPKRVDIPRADGGFETRWLIGITGGMLFVPKTERPGLPTAVGYGFDQTKFIVKSSISGLYHVIVGSISSCNLRGPVGIAQTSGQAASQGLLSFIWFIAVLSTAVGMLNLFPIPILDGGHLVFHAYEAISGRPPSDSALRIMMGSGLALIGMLMVFALTNDFICP